MQKIECQTGVYCIRNTVNGKVYVGGAYRSFKERERKHKRKLKQKKHHNRHLQAAWNLYGEESFEWIILERCLPVKETIEEQEQYWIDFYQAADRACGYNLSPTAGSVLGLRHSEESKMRTRAAQKEAMSKPECKAKMSVAQKEIQNRPEVRAKKSASTKEVQSRPGIRAKIDAALREAMRRPEVRAKISISNKETHNRPEVRARISASKQNLSKETRAKMSVAAKRRCAGNEEKARMKILAAKGRAVKEESKQRAKESMARKLEATTPHMKSLFD